LILVAEDNPAQARALELVLKAQGYGVEVVANGQEALAAAEAQAPDLILLDGQMPVLDGFQTVRELRARERTQLIPVLMVTGEEEVASRVRGLEAGADDYILKPYNVQELLARVRSNLRTAQLQREVEAQRVRLARLELIRQAAATLNHEVNNPLMVIQGRTELLSLLVGEEAEPHTQAILEAVERIREVTWKLAHVVEPRPTQYVGDRMMLDLEGSLEGTR